MEKPSWLQKSNIGSSSFAGLLRLWCSFSAVTGFMAIASKYGLGVGIRHLMLAEAEIDKNPNDPRLAAL